MTNRKTLRPCAFPGCRNRCVTTKASYCLECQQMFAVAKHKTYAAIREYHNEFITLAQLTERLATVRKSAVILLAQMDEMPRKPSTITQPSGQTLSVLVPNADKQCFYCPMLGAACRERRIPPCKPAGGKYREYRAEIERVEVYG